MPNKGIPIIKTNLSTMNKLILAISIAVLLQVTSCAKDDAPTGCTPTDTSQTYTANVKPILDTHCINSGCHDVSGGSSGLALTSYAGAVEGVKNHNLITQLQTGTMPQGMPKLPDSLINKI